MNILLISQCDKRALVETRRILDQFAERRGDRTWQTPITQDGLDTLRRLLRKTARRNTAVACHWIRGLDHSELLWIVGDARRFNAQGAVPTETTSRNVLRANDENDWHTGEDIHLLTALAALLHDLGKASEAFQDRLAGRLIERNQYRHEWVSLRLFEAFVGTDDDATWLKRLIAPTPADDATWIDRLRRDGVDSGALPTPFAALRHAPLAQAVGWLVVTHHRLPVLPAGPDGRAAEFQVGGLHRVLEQVDAAWNERPGDGDRAAVEPYWRFRHGLPVSTDLWRRRSVRIARRLLGRLEQAGAGDWLANPYVMHLARLSLMLADHHYSSLKGNDPGRVKVPAGYPLHANTSGPGQLNQTLDEHLLGVAQHGGEVTRALPRFEQHLPRLARHKGLRRRSADERFRWQDKAAELAAGVRERSERQGAFIVNMASTGCGKTLANARVMYALADPERGMRCAFALGLRTLTLQTGRAFRDLLDLSDEDLAIRVGGSASRELFDHYAQQAEASGSASTQTLLDEESSHVRFEGNIDAHPLLQRAVRDPAVRAMLLAPLLVCTIDHLVPATESQRGGRQIAPMLRLMSGDLVLDEPDDFDIDDLPALARLVHWAGMLGARVLLSSATLPPALVQGLFEAYRHGRLQFERNRGEQPGAAGRAATVCCLWLDEFRQSVADCSDAATFETAHRDFATRRAERLVEVEMRRRVRLEPLTLSGVPRDEQTAAFAGLARDAALALHRQHHTLDPHGGGRVSFGLIRMANIEPLVEVALALYRLGAPPGVQVHLCVYHSQFPLLIRSAIERRIDAALDRRRPAAVFDLPDVRQRIDASGAADQIFIVLGSPVTEVGRDHDYDWAVVEPSSMRSLIQLAGRVRRHRPGDCGQPNIVVFDANLRHFRRPGDPAYCRPGFETAALRLEPHQLGMLWPEAAAQRIDARPRIVRPAVLQPRARLADLEHERMRLAMLPRFEGTPQAARGGTRSRAAAPAAAPRRLLNAACWWDLPPADALLTAVLPQQQPFRFDPIKRVELLLRPDEDGSDVELVMLLDAVRGRPRSQTELLVDRGMHHRIPDSAVHGPGIAPWGDVHYLTALQDLARELDLSLDVCARRFGTVSVPCHDAGWRFHPVLGFTRRLG